MHKIVLTSFSKKLFLPIYGFYSSKICKTVLEESEAFFNSNFFSAQYKGVSSPTLSLYDPEEG